MMGTPLYVDIWDIPRNSLVKFEGMDTKFRFVKMDGIYAQIEHLCGVHKGEISFVGLGTKLRIVKEKINAQSEQA